MKSHDCARNTHENFFFNIIKNPNLNMCVLVRKRGCRSILYAKLVLSQVYRRLSEATFSRAVTCWGKTVGLSRRWPVREMVCEFSDDL